MSYEMNELLTLMCDAGASDLHIQVGVPPTLRLSGTMTPVDGPNLTPEDTENLVKSITSDHHQQKVKTSGGADFGFAYLDRARFRVSVLRAKGSFGMVLRQIPNTFFKLREIGLPEKIKDLLTRPRGLILVTGPTGSGKSTTLAALLDYINSNFHRHLITIEEPIEFVHSNKKSIITQREVPIQTNSFADGLRAALREDADIVLVGEMRDLETISLALTAAETGLLVFGTLHTNNARKTVDRIIDVFPADQQGQVRTMLSASLRGVVAQLLMKRCDKPGRTAVNEIMFSNSASAAIIREGATQKLYDVIIGGKNEGMQFMDDAIWQKLQAGMVTPQEAYMKAIDKTRFKKFLPAEDQHLGDASGENPMEH